jgi:hypothetical protein
MKLGLLRAAAQLGIPSVGRALQPGILRFTLEYKEPPIASAARAEIASLLGGEGFDLFTLPPGDDPLILILQFPGIPREQSASFLFQTAQELADSLRLRSCVPDVDPGWRGEDELGRDTPESLGGLIWALCNSNADPPTDRKWAVKTVRADAAWVRYNVRGKGVLVGQPDTGVAEHRELHNAVDMARGIDIILGGGLPVDPLSADMASPGHGTATSSCVASREAGRMVGAAPESQLVPIRCVNSVILSSGAAVAAAIDHARRQGCDVVSMSLGGPVAFRDLERAIIRAVDAGMIVLAAAGNCVGWVVYPAWDPNVIAVAAIDADLKRWRGSCRGKAVDISAPGESVYVARRTTPTDATKTLVEAGQGTSFAVAITAGCAALWLSRHTRAAVRSEAEQRGVTVQALFRAALQQTAHVPADWTSDEMGAGVIDADALLALALDRIMPTTARIDGHPALAALGPEFDWERHGAEAGYLAFQLQQRRDPARMNAVESLVAPRPSAQLAEAVRRTGHDPQACLARRQ